MYMEYIFYAMIGSLPHAIAFGMCHVVGSKSIPQGHVICLLTMWYAFLIMWYASFKTTKNFSEGNDYITMA